MVVKLMVKKIALLTGGGDCPGLNAVIRAATRTAILQYGYEVIGYTFGYRGLYENNHIPLTIESVSGILHRGGTILYASNKDNLFDYPKRKMVLLSRETYLMLLLQILKRKM
jgi:6-phosphofructokinase 1